MSDLVAAARAVAAAAFCGAAGVLLVQAALALRRAPRDRAPARGSARRGIVYALTGAMSPARKESVRHHPFLFATGAALHAGIFAALLAWLASLAGIAPGRAALLCAGLAAAGALGAVVLLVRRATGGPLLREISVADDYVAGGAVLAFLGVSLAALAGLAPAWAWHLAGAALCVYAPFGKLRHAVFFFVGRIAVGRRLGGRGVYPPAVEAGRGAPAPAPPPHVPRAADAAR